MDVYKTEEEQVQAIKDWWKENAVALITGVVLGLLALGGYRYWIDQQKQQSEQASLLYSQMLVAKDKKTVNAEALINDYADTPYAALAALMQARENIDNGKPDEAVTQLKWVLEHGDDEGIQHIARQRLARVYIDKKDLAAAEALLENIETKAFSASYHEIKGDLELAKNQLLQAKENYRLALTNLKRGEPRYRIVKMKMDDLGQVAQKSGDK